MVTSIGKLVAIDVKAGGASDSQSGLNVLNPRIYGRLADEGCAKDVAFVVIHPASNFHGHYLLGPMQQRKHAVLALNTRFVGNDTTLLMERCIQDLGAGVRFLRDQGFRRVVLIGNSGGGSLSALYQAEAEHLTVSSTPDGRPMELSPGDLPPVDAIAMCAAHPGRASTLTDWMDPSMINETDPLSSDPALDMFDEGNRPPYRPQWLAAYRAAQRARNERITDGVLAMLRALDRDPDAERPKDLPFFVFRTAADPRFVDLTIDPSDRSAGTARGSARATNHGLLGLARVCSLRSWLSQWSIRTSRADGPACLARTSVPVLAVDYSADPITFPAQAALWQQAAPGRCIRRTIKGATHHMQGQTQLVGELADLLVQWNSDISH